MFTGDQEANKARKNGQCSILTPRIRKTVVILWSFASRASALMASSGGISINRLYELPEIKGFKQGYQEH